MNKLIEEMDRLKAFSTWDNEKTVDAAIALVKKHMGPVAE